MFYVYVLISSKDGKQYVGFSEDIKRRVEDHSSGKVESTRGRRPLELIYYEAYLDRLDAEGREKFLKSGAGKRFLTKQLKHYLDSRGGAAR
jgi:putative endonuclease